MTDITDLKRTSPKRKKESDENPSWWPFVLWAAVVVIFWLSSAKILSYLYPKITFADSYGAVNTLFAGLAFAGVIYSIILQGEELRLQRKEIRESREELARTAKAQHISAQLAALTHLIHESEAQIDDFKDRQSKRVGGEHTARQLTSWVNIRRRLMDELIKLMGELSPPGGEVRWGETMKSLREVMK